MKKDVIYIDIEDDITAIIGKVKSSAEKIVALVPPKRAGVLQSAVNMKLLQKIATEENKRIVLITSDALLTSLASVVKMPVAKNLQSRPEVPEKLKPQDEESDVINGSELPVGEIAAAAGAGAAVEKNNLEDLDFVDKKSADGPSSGKKEKPSKKGKGPFGKVNVPNFMAFRKKLFLLGGGGVLLIGFLVWALVLAPSATVTISAKTTAVDIDRSLALVPSLDSSKTGELELKPNVQEIKKTASVEFDATGKKDTGDKASGSITLSNADSSDAIAVPAGAAFTAANGKKFTSDGAVTVPGATVSGGQIKQGTATVSVKAAEIGPEYNIAAQAYTVSGVSGLSAGGTAMAGGTKQQVTVVSQEDVDSAKSKLSQQSSDEAKAEITAKFGSDYIVIAESFSTNVGDPIVTPAINEQATKAKLSIETTYNLVGLARSDVKNILDDALNDALSGTSNQSVFNDGESDIRFQSYKKLSNGNYVVDMKTTGYIGATIDTAELAKQLTGKRYGEIEQIVNKLPGVTSVDIKFSPFWVASAPSDPNKISIKFSVVNESD
ncbi:MAG: hypothetical protein PVI21_01195 [Candidatus Woesebacteria bacterium]|jgi:hypothetical protein